MSSGTNTDLVHVQPGGTLEVLGGGSSGAATLDYRAILEFASGYVFTGTVGDQHLVEIGPGGFASGVVVRGQGELDVLAGGVANGTVVSNGAILVVSSGAVVSNTVLLNGGLLEILDGGSAVGTVSSGGSVFRGTIVSSGQTVSGLTVTSGGREVVNSGGIDSATTVTAGGVQYVSQGGLANGTSVTGANAVQYVIGVASGTEVASGATQRVGEDGSIYWAVASGTQVSAGGIVETYKTTVSLTVGAGGRDNIHLLGYASATQILSGGIVSMMGGHADGTVIQSGGELDADMAMSVNGTIISSGGIARLGRGTNASGTTVMSGGILDVRDQASAVGTTVQAGGFERVQDGSFDGTTIDGGVVEIASDGGPRAGYGAIGFTGAGGSLLLDNAAAFRGSISGLAASVGAIDLGSIGYAWSTTISYSDNGSGGTLTLTEGEHSATLQLVGSYALSDFHIADDGHGGTMLTDAPGMGGPSVPTRPPPTPPVIPAPPAGYEVVSGGSVISGSVIVGSGGQQVDPGGVAVDTSLAGMIVTSSSGDVVTQWYFTPRQIVYGTTSGTVLTSGAVEFVQAGGEADGTIVQSRGQEVVNAGGTASGTIIAGGMLDILSGGTVGSSTVTFTSAGGELWLRKSHAFTGAISGLTTSADSIYLFDVAGGPSATLGYSDSGTSGTLTVTDGTHSTALLMLGQYTAADFHLDYGLGGTGTKITGASPVSSGSELAFPH